MSASDNAADAAGNPAAPRRAAAARPPLIGITTYLEQAQTGVWDVRASFLPKVYMDAVTDVGGVAILLPPQPATAETARQVLGALDGLIVSGGADVDPALYGQEPHERTGAPRTDRDAWEEQLFRAAIDLELPFLGICRGAQVLNVALGGDLIQHVPDLVGDDRYQLGDAVFNEIDVEVDPGTQIAGILGEGRRARAHLYHHQAIGAVAPELTVTSRTEDGVIESLELPTVPFGVAVQWHPEEHTEDRRLFAGLVEAAAGYRAAAQHRAAREHRDPATPPTSKEDA